MKIELDRKGLETLVKGSQPNYNQFQNPLVKKAGHEYSDQYGITNWRNLDKLSDDELYTLYLFCR
jgi:hypothetical protein